MKIAEIDKLKNVKLQTIAPEKTIRDASRKLVQYNIGALPVCDAEGNLVGIITERDILRVTAKDGSEGVGHNVASVMSRKVHTCVSDDDIETAMQVMTKWSGFYSGRLSERRTAHYCSAKRDE